MVIFVIGSAMSGLRYGVLSTFPLKRVFIYKKADLVQLEPPVGCKPPVGAVPVPVPPPGRKTFGLCGFRFLGAVPTPLLLLQNSGGCPGC